MKCHPNSGHLSPQCNDQIGRWWATHTQKTIISEGIWCTHTHLKAAPTMVRCMPGIGIQKTSDWHWSTNGKSLRRLACYGIVVLARKKAMICMDGGTWCLQVTIQKVATITETSPLKTLIKLIVVAQTSSPSLSRICISKYCTCVRACVRAWVFWKPLLNDSRLRLLGFILK